MMPSNSRRYILHTTLYSLAVMLMSGSVIQSFLLENGVGAQQVSLYLSAQQIVQCTVMLLFSFVVDRVQRVIRTYALFGLLQSVFFAVLIGCCFLPAGGIGALFPVVFALGAAVNLLQAISGLLSYKLPYHVMDMREYGRVSGTAGVVYGITGAALSALMAYLAGQFLYNLVMAVFFALGAGLLFLGFWLSMRYQPVAFSAPEQKPKSLGIFRYKPFYILLLPNLLRAFCSGTFGVSMTIGFSMGLTDPSSGAVLTLLLQAATVIGCFVYSRLIRSGNDGVLILCASLCLLLLFPGMLVSGTQLWFYALYFLSGVAIIVIDYAVPVAVTRIVDYAYMGRYTSFRMMTHMLGMAAASAVAPWLVEQIGGVPTLLLASGCMTVCGAVYFFYMKKLRGAAAAE